MKKNIYTDGISRIKASDELIKKGIENIRGSEVREEIINLNSAKAKRKWIKPLGAIAASLVIVIGLGSVSVFSKDESVKNPFILTANAEELNSETYINIGKLNYNNYTTYWKYISPERGLRLGIIETAFDLNVQCVGKNIETVTYSSDNSRIFFEGDDIGHGISAMFSDDCVEARLNDAESNEWYNEEDAYTFDYDKQPYDGGENVESEENEGSEAKKPLSVAFFAEIAEGDDMYISHSLSSQERVEVSIEAFNKYSKNLSVDITATYTDGSTLTKTLKFKCEKSEGGEVFDLYAIVV